MILGWQNLLDAATLATDSEIATLPVAHVQQVHLSRKWHTAAGVTSAYMLADLGASQTAGLLGVMGANLTENATLRLRGSVTDPTATGSLAYDSTTIAAGAVTGYGAAYKSFTDTAARYWRLDLADSAVADHLQVGRIFLGPKWVPAYPHMFDWHVVALDESRRTKSWGRQTHVDVRPQARVLEFVLDHMTEAEAYAAAFALARAAGIASDVLAIPAIDGAYVSEQSVWGLVEASEPIVNREYGIYRQKFRIEERL